VFNKEVVHLSNNELESLRFIVVHPQIAGIRTKRGRGDRTDAKPHRPIIAQLAPSRQIEIETGQQSRTVEYLLGKRLARPLARLNDLLLVTSLLKLVSQELDQFPASSSMPA
jgi:hypothetical protein